MPASFQAALPKLRLEVLVYAETPAQRMVFINGRKYVEGGRIDDGLVVEEITQEGAVLSQQGQRFLLRD
jgi:general secretion pathway protein B